MIDFFKQLVQLQKKPKKIQKSILNDVYVYQRKAKQS